MRKKFTDKVLRQFFWENKYLPYENKATYLLGDLSKYGVSRCKKVFLKKKWVWYEFDIYREGDFIVTLGVELPLDFSNKDVVRSVTLIWDKGGVIVSNDTLAFKNWNAEIRPHYNYDHARIFSIKVS